MSPILNFGLDLDAESMNECAVLIDRLKLCQGYNGDTYVASQRRHSGISHV